MGLVSHVWFSATVENISAMCVWTTDTLWTDSDICMEAVNGSFTFIVKNELQLHKESNEKIVWFERFKF